MIFSGDEVYDEDGLYEGDDDLFEQEQDAWDDEDDESMGWGYTDAMARHRDLEIEDLRDFGDDYE